jgi:hypothetical protein
VFVQSFPVGDVKQQVSREGGGQPRWRRDGKELYYRTLGAPLMAVDIALGARIEAGIPRLLFNSTSTNATTLDPTRHMWAALPDGQRFLTRINTTLQSVVGGTAGVGTTVATTFTPPGQAGAPAGGQVVWLNGLTVLLHWTSALPKGGK